MCLVVYLSACFMLLSDRRDKMIKVIVLKKSLTKSRAPTQKNFQRWVNQTLKIIPKKIPCCVHEICIVIIDRKTSAKLNKTYRHKKGSTNVLSFPYEKMPGIQSTSLGDLAICADIVAIEAKAQHKKLISHWAHLTVHGVLHLSGYDHVKDRDAVVMEQWEIEILEKLGIKNPYA